MIRIVKLRGAPANHAVLVGASDYADLINFMEGVEASAEFATLRGAAEAQVVGTTYYRAVKIWNPQYDEDSQTGRTEFREKPRFDPIFSKNLGSTPFFYGNASPTDSDTFMRTVSPDRPGSSSRKSTCLTRP